MPTNKSVSTVHEATNAEDVEVGGSLNILTPDRPQALGTHSMSPNSTLVQVEKYAHADALKKLRAA